MEKKPKLLLKQKIMRQVLLALVPTIAGAVYFFGWRCLAMVVLAGGVGFFVEWLFERGKNKPVSEAVFVTTTLLALVLPPSVPWHVLVIGTVVAVMIGKEVFGGFAKNIFNPALAGRCFVYISFPIALTATWAPAAEGPWGALGLWSTAATVDSVSSATPMSYAKGGQVKLVTGEADALEEVPYKLEDDETVKVDRWSFIGDLIWGRRSGTAGVTSALLISIGGIYLFVKKIAARETILSLIITYAVLNQVLYWFGVPPVPGALPAVLGGGFLFGAFYMATDPISSPKTKQAKIIYGIIIGTSTLVIRNFSIFNGGLMFSILIGNMFAPILDYAVRSYKASRKKVAA